MKSAVVAAIIAAVTATNATKSHGFHDPHAPREAAHILNTLRNVDHARCHWKLRGHTIACTALVRGDLAQLTFWSGGRRVYYVVCVSGSCSKPIRAKHVFGRPY